MITGIAWDHRRCWGPLEASIEPYRQVTGEDVQWDRRSLYSFGEGDLGNYADKYDLIVYDHPFVGDVAHNGWMIDLAPLLSVEDRRVFEGDSVGPSWRSYHYGGGIWGLPVDAAVQTAAWRQDLLDRADLSVPTSLIELRIFAEAASRHGLMVGWPSVPTDLMCTLISMAASLGYNPGHGAGAFLDTATIEAVVVELRALARLSHPQSAEWNPIRCLDHMAANDDVAYVPYLFNYTNYSANSLARPITFGAPPILRKGLPVRTLLGGAGIGISAKAKNPEAAFAYAMYLCAQGYQSGDYVRFGGQPGSRAAWTSAECNARTGGFFADCLPTIDAAYLRPTHAGFVPFFRDATHELKAVIFDDAPVGPFCTWLNEGYDRILSAAKAT